MIYWAEYSLFIHFYHKGLDNEVGLAHGYFPLPSSNNLADNYIINMLINTALEAS